MEAKEIQALFLQVSLYEYLLPVLDENHMLFVSAIDLLFVSAMDMLFASANDQFSELDISFSS